MENIFLIISSKNIQKYDRMILSQNIKIYYSRMYISQNIGHYSLCKNFTKISQHCNKLFTFVILQIESSSSSLLFSPAMTHAVLKGQYHFATSYFEIVHTY